MMTNTVIDFGLVLKTSMFNLYSNVILWLCVIYHLQMHYTKWISSILGAFVKLQITTISFVMSICPSVRPHGTTGFPLDGF